MCASVCDNVTRCDVLQGNQTSKPARARLLLLPEVREEGDDPAQPRQEEDQGE